MNLCSDGHEEVCYSTRNCPACDAISDKDKAISDLEDKLATTEETISDLRGEINGLEREIPRERE